MFGDKHHWTNIAIAMENGPIEDVFPIQNMDIPYLVFSHRQDVQKL